MTTLPSMTVAEALGAIPDVIATTLGRPVMERSLSAAGLPEDISSRVGQYVPQTSINKLMQAAARSAGDDLFGLTFTDHLSVSDYGAWGGYVLEAPTLGGALRRAISVMYLHSDTDKLDLRVGSNSTHLEYTYGDRATAGYRHVALAALGPMLSIPRHYMGPKWRPVSVGLDSDEYWSVSRIETHLGTQVRCEESCLSVEMNNLDLGTPNPHRPVHWTTRSDVVRACVGGPPKGLVPIVEMLILQGLGTDDTSLDNIAAIMSTSKRTLQRQLDHEGRSFRSVSASAKMRHATELLAGSAVSVTEIALRLNYSTPGHFARAFRKIHGTSPQDFRAACFARQN